MDEDVKELIGGLAEEMRRGFAKVDAEMRRGFEKVDARFERVEARLDGMDLKIDDKFEEAKRHFGVVAEDLRGQIQAVAEGADATERRLDARLTSDLSEIKSMIPISFTQLDGRIRSLETDNADLQSRVERLESAAH